MRTLHVAALPFPSHQGTQALLHAMLSALGSAGHDTHLLCYAHGAPLPPSLPYRVHRARAEGFSRSLRSGPSLDKLWLDLSLAWRLRSLHRQLAPELVLAHHVEAAALGLALGIEPLAFVAHTSLREELATYFPRPLAPPLRASGALLDRRLVRQADLALAVSPRLAELLAEESARSVQTLALAWPVAEPASPGERTAARRALGLADGDEVALYAGNLDPYQGISTMLPGLATLARARPAFRWLIATCSPPGPLLRRVHALGFGERVRIAPLAGEEARRAVHAAADLVLVPRASAGGVPIKLLDALARAVPVVAAERALAGLPLTPFCSVVTDDDPEAWAVAIDEALRRPEPARQGAFAGRSYVEQAFSAEGFVRALARLVRAQS